MSKDTKYLISVNWEAMQSVMVMVLKEDLASLRNDWNKVYKTKKGMIWSTDFQEDLEEISSHISAYKKLLKYYGENP